MHSFEKLSRFSVLPSAYASSMNKIPPIAELIISLVFIAVWPKYPAIRSDRVTFLNVPDFKIPRWLNIFPRIFATSVLPVPGGPHSTVCIKSPVARASLELELEFECRDGFVISFGTCIFANMDAMLGRRSGDDCVSLSLFI